MDSTSNRSPNRDFHNHMVVFSLIMTGVMAFKLFALNGNKVDIANLCAWICLTCVWIAFRITDERM